MEQKSSVKALKSGGGATRFLKFLLLAHVLTAPALSRAQEISQEIRGPWMEISHPTFGLQGKLAFPSVARRADDDTIFCAFAFKRLSHWESIYIVSTHDQGKTWSDAHLVMGCPGPGYIADPNILITSAGVTVFATFVPKDPAGRFARSQFLRSTSIDGVTGWSTPEAIELPHKYVSGKIQPPVWIDRSTVVMGYSYDLLADHGTPATRESEMYARAGVLISHDAGQNWKPAGDVFVNIIPTGADEPALLKLLDGDLYMVVRTSATCPYETRSHDAGATWEEPGPSVLNAHDSPTALLRLHDGDILRAWDDSDKHRYPLVASISTDECGTWSVPRSVMNLPETAKGHSFSACYPSIAETTDGTILMIWWETSGPTSQLGLARFNRQWVQAGGDVPKSRN
jgi:hypothetical protein